MIKIVMGVFVLYNFIFVYDDFDESYFLDDDDNDGDNDDDVYDRNCRDRIVVLKFQYLINIIVG